MTKREELLEEARNAWADVEFSSKAQCGAAYAVLAERMRQDEKWGEQNHSPLKWLAILMEEVGEVSKAILESPDVEKTTDEMKEEIVQVAAVALCWIEQLWREEGR